MNNKIKPIIDDQYEGFCRGCFAAWITCLWGKYDDSFTFEENKDAFFYLLERLLREGKVKFDHPDKPVLWEETPEVILSYFKTHWPTNVATEDDVDLTIYFYRMPGIAWLGPDGDWHGS
jgi:hypothetical protein